MDEIFINLTNVEWIKKYTNDVDFISIQKLIDIVEELDDEVYHLKEKIKDLENEDKEDGEAYDKWYEFHRFHEVE